MRKCQKSPITRQKSPIICQKKKTYVYDDRIGPINAGRDCDVQTVTHLLSSRLVSPNIPLLPNRYVFFFEEACNSHRQSEPQDVGLYYRGYIL